MRKSSKDKGMNKERATDGRKFVRYKEGAEKYGMGMTKFKQMAREAGALYKVDRTVLVNCEVFENYLETFRMF